MSVLFVNRIVRKVKKEIVRLFLYYKTVRPIIVRKVKKETIRLASGEASLFLYYKTVRPVSKEASFSFTIRLPVQLQGKLHSSFTICNVLIIII